jgi:GNAT superfamily N-acetyltransferase
VNGSPVNTGMSLADGYTDLPAGKLANVVTCLEMFAPPERRADPPESGFLLERLTASQPDRYRALFRRIGEPYLWFSRLLLNDAQLRDILADEAIEAFALRHDSEDAGILELDFRTPNECELSFFGVVESLVGSGAGRWLMNRAMESAWSKSISRMWVHTCSLDHPSAVPFYIRSGFRPFKRQIEVCDDPRTTGLLSRNAAPQVPII